MSPASAAATSGSVPAASAVGASRHAHASPSANATLLINPSLRARRARRANYRTKIFHKGAKNGQIWTIGH